jgi:hypothetical protein
MHHKPKIGVKDKKIENEGKENKEKKKAEKKGENKEKGDKRERRCRKYTREKIKGVKRQQLEEGETRKIRMNGRGRLIYILSLFQKPPPDLSLLIPHFWTASVV